MSKRLVLVDSSVWVNYFIGRQKNISESIGAYLGEHRIATNDVIRMEILTGAKDEAQYSDLSDQWEALHNLPVTTSVWRRAERLRFELRRKGHLVPLADAVIASSAISYDCNLLHADRHFDFIAAITPLKTERI